MFMVTDHMKCMADQLSWMDCRYFAFFTLPPTR